MFASNPFSELGTIIPPAAMQAYVVIMAILVVGGTILDVIHKKSAKYFFEHGKKAEKARKRELSGGEKASIAMQTVGHDVLTSGEFCNPKRRASHLMMMYGFIVFLLTTVIMVFGYASPMAATPGILPVLWHLGALSVSIGGLWFWFAIRVDVSAEGNPWYRVAQADLFILSLLGTNLFGLIWSILQSSQAGGWTVLFLILFIVSSLVLFAGVLWSKFAHMFFKPAAAYQKRILKADGSRENLPEPADRSDPAQRDRRSMELLKDAPMDMGLGIKREAPRHY